MLYKRNRLLKKSATAATTTGIEEFLHRNKDRISCVDFYLILAAQYIHKNDRDGMQCRANRFMDISVISAAI